MVSIIASSISRQDIVGWDWFRGLILWLLMSNEVVFICRTYFGFVYVMIDNPSVYLIELQNKLLDTTGTWVHESTIC